MEPFNYIFLSLASIGIIVGIITLIVTGNFPIIGKKDKIFLIVIYWWFFIVCGLGQIVASVLIIQKELCGLDRFLKVLLLSHSGIYVFLFLLGYKYLTCYYKLSIN